MIYNLDTEVEYLVAKCAAEKDLTAVEMTDEVLETGSMSHEFQTLCCKFAGKQNGMLAQRRPDCNKVVDVKELLEYDGGEFLELAYLLVLGRPSDTEGRLRLQKAMQEGRTDREGVLKRLEASAEGKSIGVGLTGFSLVEAGELLVLEDRDFLRMAYLRLLGRWPDPGAQRSFLFSLRSGDISKAEILKNLHDSPEGQKKGIEIHGLEHAVRRQERIKAIFRIPAAGKAIRWLWTLLRMNRKVKNLVFYELELEDRVRTNEESFNGQLLALRQTIQTLSGQINALERRVDTFVSGVASRVEDEHTLISGVASDLKNLQVQLRESFDRTENLESKSRDLSGNIEQVAADLSGVSGYLQQIGNNVASLNSITDMHQQKLQSFNGADIGDIRLLPMLQVEVSSLKAALKRIESMSTANPAAQGLPEHESGRKVQSDVPVPAQQGNPYDSIDYFDFENHFRGSREIIKGVQKIYLPYYEGKKKVLDLGCGRGEFTELLVEKGIGVTGVDLYPPYISYMEMLGLPAVLGDAIEYLSRQESTDGIFVGQVVEHISIEQIIRLCRLAYQKLEKNCYLIMETPNPTSLAIYTNSFYQDPSHQKPVHPLTLQYIAEKAGFTSVEILYTDSSRLPYRIPKLNGGDPEYRNFNEAMERVSELLYGSQDYAIIARK